MKHAKPFNLVSRHVTMLHDNGRYSSANVDIVRLDFALTIFLHTSLLIFDSHRRILVTLTVLGLSLITVSW